MVGHPLDTIKSNMQVQSSYIKGSVSSVSVAKDIWKKEGAIGFYRGCIPPMWGSAVYRGIMMSVFEYSFTLMENSFTNDSFMKKEVFYIRPLVPLSAGIAGAMRSIIEQPIEYTKIMGQTREKWKLRYTYNIHR